MTDQAKQLNDVANDRLDDQSPPDGVIRLVVNNTSRRTARINLTRWFHHLFADIQEELRRDGAPCSLWVDTQLSFDEDIPGGPADDAIPYGGNDWRLRVLRGESGSVRVPPRQPMEIAWYFSIRRAEAGDSALDPDTLDRLLGEIEALLRTKNHIAGLSESVPPAVTCAYAMTAYNTAEPVFSETPYSVDDLAEVCIDLCTPNRYRLALQGQEVVVSGESVYRVMTPWPEYRAKVGAGVTPLSAWRAWTDQQERACGSRYMLVTREEGDAILAGEASRIDALRPISVPGLDEEVPGLELDDDADGIFRTPNARRIDTTPDPSFGGQALYVLTFVINSELDSDWGWPLFAKLTIFLGGLPWYVHYYFPRLLEDLFDETHETNSALPSIRVRQDITAMVLQEFPFIKKEKLIVLDTEDIRVFPDGSVSIVDSQYDVFPETGRMTTLVIPIDPSDAKNLKHHGWTEWDCSLLNSAMRHLLKACFDVSFDVRFTGLVDVSWVPQSFASMRNAELFVEMGDKMDFVTWRGFATELSDHEAVNLRATIKDERIAARFQKARCHPGKKVAFVYVRYWVFGNVFVIRDEWTDYIFKKTGHMSVGDISKFEVAGALDEQLERACRVLHLTPKYRPDLFVDGAIDAPTIRARYPGIL